VEGAFELPRLARLSPGHQQFVELFIRSEGKLNRVQESMGISYPTARAQLHEVIRALGYEPSSPDDGKSQPVTPERRRHGYSDRIAMVRRAMATSLSSSSRTRISHTWVRRPIRIGSARPITIP